jgi:hypothetical protein
MNPETSHRWLPAAVPGPRDPADARTVATCASRHPDDISPCDGPADAVIVQDSTGACATGCVAHAARILTVVHRVQVHSLAVPGAALATFRLAGKVPW